jgi:hypothetical protein
MFGAPAAAPGNVVSPNASAVKRSRLWRWNNVFDWKFSGVLLLITTVATCPPPF